MQNDETLMLIVEDEARVASFLSRGFEEEGFRVDTCDRGDLAVEQGLARPYAVILLDWRLPGADGVSVLRRWRAGGLECPVLMLTARGGVETTVLALNSGADDYVEKPFSFEELLARVRAQLRRSARGHSVVRIGRCSVNLRTREASVGGEESVLTDREFKLLSALIRHRGQVLGRSRLLDLAWGQQHDPTTNVVDVYARYLRQKIDPPGTPVGKSAIETVRGRGYRLRLQDELSR